MFVLGILYIVAALLYFGPDYPNIHAILLPGAWMVFSPIRRRLWSGQKQEARQKPPRR